MFNRDEVIRILQCTPNEYPHVLETRFPHVLENILKLWDSPDGEAYFNDLLQPNGRGGGRYDRDGFPDDAWQEILNLKVLYDQAGFTG